MIFRGTIDLLEHDEEDVTVYADKKPISRAEFVAAGQVGIKPMAMFIVRTAEYSNQRKLKHGNDVYTVYRVYDQPNGLTELYCEVRTGGS